MKLGPEPAFYLSLLYNKNDFFPGTVYIFLWRAARKAVMTSSCHGWKGAAEVMPPAFVSWLGIRRQSAKYSAPITGASTSVVDQGAFPWGVSSLWGDSKVFSYGA